MMMPRRVAVTFYGAVEEYDILDANDRACWHYNCKLVPQLSVRELEFTDIPDARLAAWHRLVRQRGSAGKRIAKGFGAKHD